MSLVVKTKGETTVHVPRDVVAKGGEAIEKYVEEARGPKRSKKPHEAQNAAEAVTKEGEQGAGKSDENG